MEGLEGVAKRVDTPLDVENWRRCRSQEAVNYQDIGKNQTMLNAICMMMIWMELSFNLIISWVWVDDFEPPPLTWMVPKKARNKVAGAGQGVAVSSWGYLKSCQN